MNKCKDCKYHNGPVSSVGIECMQPDNQKKWNEQQEARERANAFFTKITARYKPNSAKACKKFEGRKEE